MPLLANVGNLGNGKTALLVLKALFYAQHGFHVYSNFDLKNMNYTYLEHPLEILDIKTSPNVIIGDEFYLWFDCYETDKKILRAMRNIILATRKKDMIVYASVQRISQLNLKYRDILDEIHFPYYYKELDILEDSIYVFPLTYGLNTYQIEHLYDMRYYGLSAVFNYYDHKEIMKDFFNFESSMYERLKTTQNDLSALTT